MKYSIVKLRGELIMKFMIYLLSGLLTISLIIALPVSLIGSMSIGDYLYVEDKSNYKEVEIQIIEIDAYNSIISGEDASNYYYEYFLYEDLKDILTEKGFFNEVFYGDYITVKSVRVGHDMISGWIVSVRKGSTVYIEFDEGYRLLLRRYEDNYNTAYQSILITGFSIVTEISLLIYFILENKRLVVS